MSDYDLEEVKRELKKDLEKTYGDDIEIVSYHIGVCQSGLTEQDFEKHIAKLESYKNGKYKR